MRPFLILLILTGCKSIQLPVISGLILDLDANYGVKVDSVNRIYSWTNKVPDSEIKQFVKQDAGRKQTGSGRPLLKTNVSMLKGNHTVVFKRQELINDSEDSFDHLSQGSGYTWLAVISVYEQVSGLPDVNSFFGNLRNSNIDGKGNYEGFWAGFNDNNSIWMGTRNGLTFGRWDTNNPKVTFSEPLKTNTYYLIMGRMGAGNGIVDLELFINDAIPVSNSPIAVNKNGNPSRMAIGQERDASNHPGNESFDGEISRFLIFERPLEKMELVIMVNYLKNKYGI